MFDDESNAAYVAKLKAEHELLLRAEKAEEIVAKVLAMCKEADIFFYNLNSKPVLDARLVQRTIEGKQ